MKCIVKEGKTKDKKEGKKTGNTTARGRTWTGSLCWGEKRSCSPFIHQSLRLFIYNPQWRAGGRVQMDDRSITLIKAWREGLGGNYRERIGRGRFTRNDITYFGALLGS